MMIEMIMWPVYELRPSDDVSWKQTGLGLKKECSAFLKIFFFVHLFRHVSIFSFVFLKKILHYQCIKNNETNNKT